MNLRARIDTAVTIVVAAAAVAVLVRGSQEPTAGVVGGDIEEWRDVSEAALWIGREDAPVVILEFLDFQCPFCAAIHPTVDSLVREFSPDVALAMIHFPLNSHPQARPAAVAVECSARQHQLEEFVTELFGQQDNFADEPWLAVAADAGVPDLSAFESCINLSLDSFPRIDQGVALAEGHEVLGTPTLFVNGERTSRGTLGEAVGRAVSRSRE